MFVLLNDTYHASDDALIKAQDRGFTLGDGIFETLKAEDGAIEFFDEHLQRFFHAASVFKLNPPCSSATIKARCLTLLKKNGLLTQPAVIRITLTRGVATRGIDIVPNVASTLVIMTSPFRQPVAPVSLKTSSVIRSSFSLTSHHKTVNYLENIMARHYAKAELADDALLLNEKDEIVCATTANIFFVKPEAIETPLLSCGALPGIMRAHLLRLCLRKKIKVRERVITLAEIGDFTHCFITNSLIGLVFVTAIDTISFQDPTSFYAKDLLTPQLKQ